MANVFELPARDFNYYLAEQASMGRPQAEIDNLRRRYRDANSFSGKLKGLLEPEAGKRRSTYLPVDAPQGMSIFDALISGQASPAIPQGLVDAIVGGVRGVESPAEYAKGIPPRADAVGDAFATAASAMAGGGAVPLPKGAVGANALFNRKPNNTMDEFRPETYYHGTRSDIDAFDPSMVDLGVHVGTKGQANSRLEDLIRKEDPVYTGPFSNFSNIEGQKPTSSFRSVTGPAEGAQILPLKVRADYPLRMPDVGEWDRSEVVMYYIEKMLGEDGDPRLKDAFADFDFDELDNVRDQFYDNAEWKASVENREFLDEIRDRIKDAGYDSIVYKNAVEGSRGEGMQDSMIVLDPSNLRSVNAEFNPAYSNYPDLLAANKSKAGGILGSVAGKAPNKEDLDHKVYWIHTDG